MGRHGISPIDNARNRGDGDARFFRNVADRCHFLTACFSDKKQFQYFKDKSPTSPMQVF
jgi:hypothetical protein